MSDRELYEIASQRTDARIRRWTLWAANLAVLVFFLAVVVLTSNTSLSNWSIAAFLGWGGIFTFHTIVAGWNEARSGEILSEMDKLRAIYKALPEYEKRKRLELGEDGELRDEDADEYDYEYEQTDRQARQRRD